MTARLVLGTRGSELARAQARLVEEALRRNDAALEVETRIIRTGGDEGEQPVADLQAGRKGTFTREIERALHDGEIDIAVHSAKDLPSDGTTGLEICAALPRANVDDLLVAKSERDPFTSDCHAVIATGSVRRRHQLAALNSRLNVADLRGNVPTRLRKLAESDWHGIVLARAGVERLGFTIENAKLKFEDNLFHVRILDREQFVPAGGQGIIAAQTRGDDTATKARLTAINHEPTLSCLRAEREFLRLLQGDCNSPVGVCARINSGVMKISAQIFDGIGSAPRTAHVETPAEVSPEAIAGRLMEKLNGH